MTSRLAVSLAVFFLLASIAIIIAVAVIQAHKTNYLSPGLKYGIVLDAGSSRTTVYLYQWPAEKENNTGVVSQTLKCRVDGPGISSFGQDPDQDRSTWHSMRTCMAQTLETIPLSQHNSTPLFLGATAGMRLLRSKNESACDKILLELRRYLQSLPFSFGNVSIISGEEEGLYGWITANYLMGNFVEKNLWNAWVRPRGAKTIGSLDLGGASTQIAFSTPLVEGQVPPGYTRVWLYGYEYSVYTHSFTCYGKDEAERKVLANLLRTSASSQVKNPCYHTGYSTTMSTGHIFETPCNQKTSNYNPKQQLTLVGTGDPGLCRSAVRAAFDLASCQGHSNCSFNGVYQPPVSGDFVAYAGFSYITEMFGLNQSFSLDAFDSKIRSHCSLPWKTLTEGSSKKEKYLRSYCYSANLAYVLLVEGYKFSPETWNNIRFQNEVLISGALVTLLTYHLWLPYPEMRKNINQNSVAWPLGYMLALSNMIPAEAKLVQLPMATSVFAGLLFMFSTLAILCFMFLAVALVRACY